MIVGIDPGRWKIGVAFVDGASTELLLSAIVPASESDTLTAVFEKSQWNYFEKWICEGTLDSIRGRAVQKIFIGSGTSSKEFVKKFYLPHTVVDEYGTTLEARKIYWRLHKPTGILKFFPTSLRTPPRHIDDLAAYATALRGAAI